MVGGGSSVGDDDSSKVGEVLGLLVDGLLLGLLVDGDTGGSTMSIPLLNSEQNSRFTMNGRSVSASSIFTCAASPMQQFGSASGSKTQEHAVQ